MCHTVKEFIDTGVEILTFPAPNHITQMGGWTKQEKGWRLGEQAALCNQFMHSR